jgi:hypothetical protein
MRGQDHQQSDIFSYLSPEQRVRQNHPLRAIRAMADLALWSMSSRFDAMYAKTGRPSIPPEKLLRAQLIQMLYSVRSERLLMEEIDYSVLYRWFVGMNLDEPVWDVTVTGAPDALLKLPARLRNSTAVDVGGFAAPELGTIDGVMTFPHLRASSR